MPSQKSGSPTVCHRVYELYEPMASLNNVEQVIEETLFSVLVVTDTNRTISKVGFLPSSFAACAIKPTLVYKFMHEGISA